MITYIGNIFNNLLKGTQGLTYFYNCAQVYYKITYTLICIGYIEE
jgi:hypothetical protein